jgi:hypothetical protein
VIASHLYELGEARFPRMDVAVCVGAPLRSRKEERERGLELKLRMMRLPVVLERKKSTEQQQNHWRMGRSIECGSRCCSAPGCVFATGSAALRVARCSGVRISVAPIRRRSKERALQGSKHTREKQHQLVQYLESKYSFRESKCTMIWSFHFLSNTFINC